MAVEKPNLPVFSYKFQGTFNSSVFSEVTEHTESKMIIFMSGPLQSLRLFLEILHTVDKEAEMIDFNQNLTVLSRLVFPLKFHKLSHFTRDVIRQHYRLVLSDVSLPRLSERRRRLKFRLGGLD